MGFSVDPEVVRKTGKDMLRLAAAVSEAKSYVDLWVNVEDDPGWLFSSFAGRVHDVRDQLSIDYGPGGRAHRTYERAGDALIGVARTYRQTDASSARSVDAAMDDVDVRDPAGTVTWMPATVDPAALSALLTLPDLGVESFDVWVDFTENVDYIAGLDFIKPLSGLGVADPLGPFKDAMEGDWDRIGRALNAIQTVAAFWYEVAGITQALPNEFTRFVPAGTSFVENDTPGNESWAGNAADAATHWLFELASKGFDHSADLDSRAGAITLEMVVVRDLTDELINLIEDLLAIMPWGQSLDDYLKDLLLPWEAAGRVKEILGVVAKLLTKVTLIVDAGMLVFALVCELAALGGVDFPEIDGYDAPDVDG